MVSDPSTLTPSHEPAQPPPSGQGDAPRKPGRRERRSQELRDRIYLAAQALFLEYGFAATTVNQIADAADVAQATFFNHFQSKTAILGAMTEEVFAQLESLMSEVLSQPGTPQERIRRFARRVADETLAVRGLAKDVLLELHQIGVQSGDVAPHLAGMREPFERMLREGQRQRTVRDDLSAEFLAEFVIGALNTTVMNWLIQTHYPLAVRLDQAASLLAEAIEPRPGDPPGGSSPIPESHRES
ncbi:MAG: TetR/AcrR family transcriptional regulator [Deltaproteobacteria bacterium]|nr:TetR/AcrR family transcriptional regulator [Deltaproteobacteria bacterium]MBW2398631.1 TetR/AcrR family transcriptional regulator [Deltaproteobacteria bacterium]MBW2668183.1 TetR/AcrR family transcriptional regulator [Deltaproteobacteria bacterium]